MSKLNFYPGPSRVYDQIPTWTQEAFEKGLLSINHRSAEFMEVSQTVHQLLKYKQNIPTDYQIFYISSATEAWEIILQSLVQKETFHIFNGAFGEKWYMYAQKIRGQQYTKKASFDLNTLPSFEKIVQNVHTHTEVICLTHNETSNGTYLPLSFLEELRQLFSQPLIALDATSSMGGIAIPWESIDIAFASVQKCLGLPAGLGLMIVSPKAITKAKEIKENNHYNSFLNLLKHSKNFQTTHTPNILNIYLLLKSLEHSPHIQDVEKRIRAQATRYYTLLEKKESLDYLIKNKTIQSPTVICMSGKENNIQEIKKKALQHNIVLGNGYGYWKNISFRLANFPAIPQIEIEILEQFLCKYLV